MICNPFIIYGIIFSLVCVSYELPFSNLYPNISTKMIVFILSVIITALLIGVLKNKEIKVRSKENENEEKYKSSLKIIILILFIYFLGFLYSKQIPLLTKGSVYLEYKGLPYVHVAIFNFNIYYSLYMFYKFLKYKKRSIFIQYLILYIPGILIVSRGLLMNIFLGSIFLYFICKGIKVTKKKVIIVALISVVFMYFFGVFGNLRSGPEPREATNSNYIMDVGGATSQFRESIIPKEFFWTYIYLSSPLANFQLNVNNYNNFQYNSNNFMLFLKEDILPDSISKRLGKTDRNRVYLITPQLNVGTMFMNSYVDFGMIGSVLVFINFIVFYLIYIKLLKRNTVYYQIGIAMLCTLSVLSVFNNMLVFIGMSLQLIYPLIVPILKRIKIRN